MEERRKSAADEYLSLDDEAILRQCAVDHYRSSGPGGQKRNKTSSAVRLRHRPTGLAVTAVEQRSQHDNKRRALRRLRAAIALGVRTPIELDGYAKSGLLASCLSAEGRLCVGRRDHRYHAAVCEILDLLAACAVRVSDTARQLGVSTGNLTTFIRNDPKLLVCVNRMRSEAGVKPLR